MIWFKNVLFPAPGLPVKTVKVVKFIPPPNNASIPSNPVKMPPLCTSVVTLDAFTTKSSALELSRTMDLKSSEKVISDFLSMDFIFFDVLVSIS